MKIEYQVYSFMCKCMLLARVVQLEKPRLYLNVDFHLSKYDVICEKKIFHSTSVLIILYDILIVIDSQLNIFMFRIMFLLLHYCRRY